MPARIAAASDCRRGDSRSPRPAGIAAGSAATAGAGASPSIASQARRASRRSHDPRPQADPRRRIGRDCWLRIRAWAVCAGCVVVLRDCCDDRMGGAGMNMETNKPAQIGGDWNVRGRDAETALVGPITATIIDADRRVRAEWSNGFPNWAMYRAAYCGDAIYQPQVRAWCVAYAIAYCEAGGVRKGMPADEIGCLAGWDAFYALLNHKWLIAGQDVADIAAV